MNIFSHKRTEAIILFFFFYLFCYWKFKEEAKKRNKKLVQITAIFHRNRIENRSLSDLHLCLLWIIRFSYSILFVRLQFVLFFKKRTLKYRSFHADRRVSFRATDCCRQTRGYEEKPRCWRTELFALRTAMRMMTWLSCVQMVNENERKSFGRGKVRQAVYILLLAVVDFFFFFDFFTRKR